MPAKRVTPRGQAAPPVEPNQGPAIVKKPPVKKKPVEVTETPGVTYIRNLRGIQCRFTLEDGKGRRIQLEPRGRRGDVDIVNDGERTDPIYMVNRELLFTEISAAEAKNIILNQQVNSSQEEHPVWSHLVNEKGQKYDQHSARIEDSIASRAITVGRVEETASGMSHLAKDTSITRAGPEVVQVPGSPDHPATALVNSVPSYVDPEEYHEFLLWKQFKAQKDAREAAE